MAKTRVLVFLSTLLVVGLIGIFASYYARGYRLDLKTLKFQPNGILVIKSDPDGASVIINGELKTATNATISLSPGTYDIDVKKDGFFTWYKRLTIEKEIVTQADISLFKNAPSLAPVTFSGATNPIISDDGTKIVYSVLPGKDIDPAKVGLWSLDIFNFPLGFTNEPKRITDGDLTNATYAISPDGRQIMLNVSNSIFVLDSGSYTSQDQRINSAAKKDVTLAEWKKEKNTKDISLIKNLPPEVMDLLSRKTSNFVFSPDENMIMYTASGSATLDNSLIPQLPGSSTQKQERNIQIGHTYVYDIKEDRNFGIADQKVDGSNGTALRWMPAAHLLLLASPNQVAIMDYDGTNRQVVYSGSYVAPFAFPFSNTTKLLILTNLGGSSSTPNLYSLTVK